MLDLLVCEVCGDILLGGYRGNVELSGQQIEILTADIPGITDLPNRAPGDRKYDQYAVFWPLGMDEPDAQPEDEQFSHDGVLRQWRRAKLNVRTGQVVPSATGTRPNGNLWMDILHRKSGICSPRRPAIKMPTLRCRLPQATVRHTSTDAPNRFSEGLPGRCSCPREGNAPGKSKQTQHVNFSFSPTAVRTPQNSRLEWNRTTIGTWFAFCS